LKLSAVSCGESSILKEQYHSVFARYRIQEFFWPNMFKISFYPHYTNSFPYPNEIR